MEKNQTAFLIPLDLKELVDELSNEEAGIIFKAIYEYEVNKTNPKLDKVLKIVFKNFKITLDKYDAAYKNKCLKNKKNITEYWEKKRDNTNEYERIQTNTNESKCILNKREREKEKENKKEKEKERENKNNIVDTVVSTPSPTFFTFDSVSQYGEKHNISEECYTNFYNWFSENHKKWKNDQEWKSTLDEWWLKDFKNDEETKLVQVDEGVFIIP